MNIQKTIAFLSQWKKELIAFVVIFLCLFLAISFPVADSSQFISRIIFFLIILPSLFIKFILKKNLAEFGLNLADNRKGFLWAGIMFVASLLITLVLFYFFKLETRYTLPNLVITNFWGFVLYEAVVMNFILFIFEFFFRGFTQTILEKKMGHWAPLLQFIIFIGFLFLIHKLTWQYTPLIILSLTGGIVAYKSKSFIYSYLMGLVFTLALDLYIIELFK
jgi:membrane protease YdiL (CAAX protease family)